LSHKRRVEKLVGNTTRMTDTMAKVARKRLNRGPRPYCGISQGSRTMAMRENGRIVPPRESRLGRAGLALREFPLNKVFRILASDTVKERVDFKNIADIATLAQVRN